MSYAEPKTSVKILRDIPWDNSYQHVRWFETLLEQRNFMESKVKHVLPSQQTYQRVKRNVMRVQILADNLYDCNYMMFQNAEFGHAKWYYAFITNVEYVNNVTSEITYEIDEIQTWLFDFKVGKCYVEREHVSDDTIGIHTVDEHLEIGEYIVATDNPETFEPGVGLYFVSDDQKTTEVNNVICAINTQGFDYDEAKQSLQDFISHLDPQRIAMLVTIPKDCIAPNKELTGSRTTKTVTRSNLFTFGGRSYTPVNNKLYTYPYCFLTVNNYNGQSETYKWEDFGTNGSATFQVELSVSPRPSITAHPTNYKGQGVAFEYGIGYENFPLIPYPSDTYNLWASQNVPTAMVNTGANIITSFATRSGRLGLPLVGLNLASNIANFNIQNEYHSVHSLSVGGSIGHGGSVLHDNHIGFDYLGFSIKPEYAQIIDEYFSRYGYAVNRYKVPELTGRSKFNYVKTSECIINGKVPSDAKLKLQSIFDNGVTLWHDDNIGDFESKNVINV